MNLLFACLMLISSLMASEMGCVHCHKSATSRMKTYDAIFAQWEKAPRAERLGHVFLSTKDVQNLRQTSARLIPTKRESFFERLDKGMQARDVQALGTLWEQGKEEAPGLQSVFDALQKQAQDADWDTLTSRVEILKQPFFHLNMKAGTTISYESDAHLWASRVWPFFDGYNRKSSVAYSFATTRVDASGFLGRLSLWGGENLKRPSFSAEADYTINRRGQVEQLDWAYTAPIPSGMQNAASIFERGVNLETMVGQKTIHLGKTPLGRESIVLNMKFMPQSIEPGPHLVVAFELKEKRADSKDNLRISGKGHVTLNWCGQIVNVKSRVDLKFSLLGLNLVSGGSEDQIRMQKETQCLDL